MRRKIKKFASLLITVILVLSIAGCGESRENNTNSSGTVQASDADTLNIALGSMSELTQVDTINGYDTETDMVLNSVVEGLFYYTQDCVAKPWLVEEYEQVDDTTYVYRIRNDVTFSDGTKLTADDVVFSLERHRDEKNASLLAWMFDKVDTIEKTGDYEVTVKLSAPDPMWQNTLATPAGGVVSKAYYEQHASTFGTAEGGLMGSGPYVVTSWDSGQQIILEENENYWNPDVTLAFKKLVFQLITDQSVVTQSLQAGQIDFTINVSDDGVKELEGNDKVIIQSSDTLGATFLSFHTSKKPFNDVNVRKAIAYAIDKDSIVSTIVGERYGEEGTSLPFSEKIVETQKKYWNGFFDTLDTYAYDIEKAKEYLAKSSVPDGFDMKLTYTAGNSTYESIALSIQQTLAQLNIQVTLESVSYAEILTLRYGGSDTRDYDTMITGWGSDYPDPVGTVLPMYVSGNNVAGGSNWAEYKSDDFDQYMEEQAAETDPEKRAGILKKALQVLDYDVPAAPLYINYSKAVVSTKVEYTFSPLSLYNIYFKDVKRAE